MDAIETLRQQALARRNARILAAKREYHDALLDITALAKKLDVKRPGRPSKDKISDYSLLRATTVAREIMAEGKPFTIAELVIEVQRRGCRSLDDPRVVARNIRNTLLYKGGYRKDEKGRWAVAGR
jgi:hypothetical protein